MRGRNRAYKDRVSKKGKKTWGVSKKDKYGKEDIDHS
jgi:hypothetical protein